jgi:hypothetical protein
MFVVENTRNWHVLQKRAYSAVSLTLRICSISVDDVGQLHDLLTEIAWENVDASAR